MQFFLCPILFLFFAYISCLFGQEQTQDPKKLKVEATFQNPDFRDEEPLVRIKDITHIQGIRENHLIGYGLVVGLNGTGDSLSSSPQTRESLVSMLERLGVNIREGNLTGKNIAAVMVTATLPPFSRAGTRIDVSVSAIGDAKDLKGGTLIVTPLLAADGKVYAVAQGNISVSAIAAQGANAKQSKGVPTSGKILNGALVEKEVGFELKDLKEINLTLTSPDFTTAQRISSAINTYAQQKGWGKNVSTPVDKGTISLSLPSHIKPFMAFDEIGHLEIRPDQKAKIVIDEQNGVIVMGRHTRISPVALTHGSITVKIVETPQVYMPQSVISLMAGSNQATAAGVNFNTLSDQATQIKNLKELQAEQRKLLKDRQNAQIDEFYKNHNLTQAANPKLNITQSTELSEILKMHDEQNRQLNENFQKQLDALEKQFLNPAAFQGENNSPSNNVSTEVSPGQPVTTSTTNIDVKEEKGRFSLLHSGASLDRFVNALNQLGISVKDTGSILMAIKNLGALHADIVIS